MRKRCVGSIWTQKSYQISNSSLYRCELINRYLPSQVYAIPLCIFPRTGVASNWISGPSNDPLCSQPRYKLLARNVDARSNGGFKIWFPIYRDSLTIIPFLDDTILGKKRENYICLDQQNIGRGFCNIQIIFQTANETEARWLHDQLIPLGSCLLVLTAAIPIWKGIMADTDSRWKRYRDLVDNRDSNERDCLVYFSSLYIQHYYLLMVGFSLYSLHSGIGIRIIFR